MHMASGDFGNCGYEFMMLIFFILVIAQIKTEMLGTEISNATITTRFIIQPAVSIVETAGKRHAIFNVKGRQL